MSSREEGFTLLELLIALGIGLLALATAMLAVRTAMFTIFTPLSTIGDELALNRVEALVRADVGVAAIVTAAQGGGSAELDLAQLDLDHQWHTWSYRVQHGLLRTTERGTQMVDDQISDMTVRFIPADQLGAIGELSAPLYANLAQPQRQTVAFGLQTATNGVIEMRLTRGHTSRSIHASSHLVLTGFTVESGPLWHAVLSRSATTKRIFLVGQKTYYTIYGTITYSFDHWNTSHQWCQQTIYDSLRNGDPRAEIQNSDANETSLAIFNTCQTETKSRELPTVFSLDRLPQ